MFRPIVLSLLLVTPALAEDGLWRLDSLNGQPVAAEVTLDLSQADRVAGQGPCNRYFGERVALAPAFAVGALGATKMACPELALEADYFAALSAVTQVEESESRLVLAGPGVELVFMRP